MCAITGFVTFNGDKPSSLVLKKMNDALSYRGPDDSGLEIIRNCALGSKRLAVIDLSYKGHQPMWDRQKRFCIVYNGEIYNYQSLRDGLMKKGYKFTSGSDTEVIINIYKEYGIRGVQKLNGMFAFAIWDLQANELFLARDPYGIKPLHYYMDSTIFVFASEIKSILIHPSVKKNLNPAAVSHYFSLGFGAIASPETIFTNIRKLPPGNSALVKDKAIRLHAYYDARPSYVEVPVSEEEAIQKTRLLLTRSVTNQLVADVPVGVFLSGGIDSSLIAAIAQKNSQKKIQTFSIGFTHSKFDESSYAQNVASFLKTDHHHETFTTHQLIDTLGQVIQNLDEPLGDPSILPTYVLSRMTRRFVTVSLSGDGGDEIFGGYPTYIAHRIAQPLSYVSPTVLEGLHSLSLQVLPLVNILPMIAHAPNLTIEYKLKRFFKGIHRNLAQQYIDFLGPTTLKEKRSLLLVHTDWALPYVEKLLVRVKRSDMQSQLQYLDMMIYLSENCLTKVDRASSYNSLEVRVPYLDTTLVEYVRSLPSHFKLKGLTLKYLLKQVAHGYLPQDIIHRPKKGFGLPIDLWLRKDLQKMISSYLSTSKLKKQGIFNERYVEGILHEHMTGKDDHSRLLWNLFVFELWYERWFV